jgi:hypothetical protein
VASILYYAFPRSKRPEFNMNRPHFVNRGQLINVFRLKGKKPLMTEVIVPLVLLRLEPLDVPKLLVVPCRILGKCTGTFRGASTRDNDLTN